MAKNRRPYGEGSIRHRPNGKYQAVIVKNGERLYYTCNTKREASEWILAQRTKGKGESQPADGSRMTFAEFAIKWLVEKKATVGKTTYESYYHTTRRDLLPVLGDYPLAQIKPAHLQTLLNDLEERGLSPRTPQKCHLVAHQILKSAVESGLLENNAADLVKAPRYRPPEMQTWTLEQARRFLQAVEGDRYEALYLLVVSAGLRRSEVLGLKWEDVDLTHRQLRVRRGLVRVRGEGKVVTDTKTHRARSIALSDEVLAALKARKQQQEIERIKAGEKWTESGHVFTSHLGTSVEPRNLNRFFAAKLKRLDIPKIHLHELRHTCATILLSEGVHPKVVQELLGHSNISTTLNIYSHVIHGMHEETMQRMGKLLSPRKEQEQDDSK
jgi:integrase